MRTLVVAEQARAREEAHLAAVLRAKGLDRAVLVSDVTAPACRPAFTPGDRDVVIETVFAPGKERP